MAAGDARRGSERALIRPGRSRRDTPPPGEAALEGGDAGAPDPISALAGGRVRIRVRAAPGARRDAILGPHGDAIRIAVRAAPERGRANEALAVVLARALGIRASDVEIASGETSRDKTVVVRGVDAASARERLVAATASASGARPRRPSSRTA
ncbi:MAG TPA: DUF167 domain-containing protein [Candidatus Binatia bacterium]|nr:DUF167 domain-containing protein [Candidatus Binatia bacterium]